MLKTKSAKHAVKLVVLGESLNPFIETPRKYLKFVCDGILVHAWWKSDLVKDLGCFDYAVTLNLPEEHAAACFGPNLSVRGWVAKELRTIDFEEHLHFGDDVTFPFLHYNNVGPRSEI